MEGVGPLNDEGRKGFFLHTLYVVSEGGLPLGVLESTALVRAAKSFRQTATRKKKPIAAKESFRWVEGYLRTQAMARQLPECEIVSLSDREGDIYEVFAAWARENPRHGNEPALDGLLRWAQVNFPCSPNAPPARTSRNTR